MAKKLKSTPKSRVRSALRKLWLESRERSEALKRSNYCCEGCGARQSSAKGKELRLEVHHNNGVEWERMLDYVYRHLLCDPKHLTVFCKRCHEEEHGQETRNWKLETGENKEDTTA